MMTDPLGLPLFSPESTCKAPLFGGAALFPARLSTEFAPVPREIQASHARLSVTPNDFLYPFRSVRHPCCRIGQLYESFHPVPYGNDDHTASRNHCRV